MYHTHDGITVMLDVKQTYNNSERAKIAQGLSQHAGVTHAEFSPYVPRVMFIEYNRNITNTQSIRSKVHELLDTDAPATCLVSM